MEAKFTGEEIRDFWTHQAKKHGVSPSASWSDVMMVKKEILEISAHLNDGDQVLDVGCANGYSTASYARHKNIRIRGVDYIPEMIALARQRVDEDKNGIIGSIDFVIGDITALNEPADTYDKVIATRVVINLQDWEQQRVALAEVARVLRPGGTLLLSEATVQGWSKLNVFRAEWGLPAIPMPGFNRYLDEVLVVQELSKTLELVEIVNFSSTYFVGTRIIKPLLINLLGQNMDVGNPNSEWNRWFASMPSAGDYGTQKLFVFRKKKNLD